MTKPLTPETLAELREKAQRANNWGRWPCPTICALDATDTDHAC